MKRLHFYTDLLTTRPSHDGHLELSRDIASFFILKSKHLLISLIKVLYLVEVCGTLYSLLDSFFSLILCLTGDTIGAPLFLGPQLVPQAEQDPVTMQNAYEFLVTKVWL
jgi:hypothetical protein